MNYKTLLPVMFILSCSILFLISGCDTEITVEPETTEDGGTLEADPEPIEEVVDDVHEMSEQIPETENNIHVVVNVDVLRLRSGPGTDYEILDRLRRGSILEVIGEKDEWLQVTRREGWVHGDYVSIPEDPDKLYEVLPVKVQPVGYSKEQVTSFIEESTSYICNDFVLPEFDHPNSISDNDLISAILDTQLMQYYYKPSGGYLFTATDFQETGRAIFGMDLRDIKLYSDNEILYREGHGCGSYTKTKVLNITGKDKELLVDVVHLIYYYSPYGDDFNYLASEVSRWSDYESEDAFLDKNLDLLTSSEEAIEQHIESFPVRRYVLSKEGDGVLYIRQSFLLDD